MSGEIGASPRAALVGPTAVGKTAVGLLLAQQLKTQIISADSMQVYRRLDIGTAKPTCQERADVRFHAVDVAEPDETWTLSDFQHLGETACDEISNNGALPLIVGGTGLYIRALTTHLDIPRTPPDEDFRNHWRHVAEMRGNEFVYATLMRLDPVSAQRIHPNDVGRLIRALEVLHATGTPLSAWHAQNQALPNRRNIMIFGLNFADRRLLYARIETRVDQMMQQGFVEEVKGLLTAGYGRDLKPMQSLGYLQISAYLAGEMTLPEAVQLTKQQTRHFARRQLIWFRADKRIHWLEAADKTSDELASEIGTHPALWQTHSINREDSGNNEQAAA